MRVWNAAWSFYKRIPHCEENLKSFYALREGKKDTYEDRNSGRRRKKKRECKKGEGGFFAI